MKSVLLIAHGSRKNQTIDEFYGVVNIVKNMLPDLRIEGTFMSCRETNIESKLMELVDYGATEIIIVPYFLFSGNHVKNTIPFQVEKFLHEHTKVKITYKEPFGIDKRLAEMIVEKIS